MAFEKLADQKKILLVCGTSETSSLARAITDVGFKVIVSTATDAHLDIDDTTNNSIVRRHGRLDCIGFTELIKNELISAVVNACHPYAAELRVTVNKAATNSGIPCFNYVRPEQNQLHPANFIFATNHKDAAELAFSSKLPVLLTVGSNNLTPYVENAHKSNAAIIARVLPRIESLTACTKAGLSDQEIIAARGPFTIEENIAVLKRYNIGVLVTKNSGKEGGFQEKIEAAKQCNCKVIIVDRPQIVEMNNFFSDSTSLIKSLVSAVFEDTNKTIIPQLLNIEVVTPLPRTTHGGNLREIAKLCDLDINQIVDFSANINPLGPIPDLKDILDKTYSEIISYPDPDCVLLKEAISTFGNWNTDMIIPANGASELLYATAALFRGKRALIPVPSYSDYSTASELAGLKIKHLKLSEEMSFKLDIQLLSKNIYDNDIIFIGRPNNPTGHCADNIAIKQLINNFKNALFVVDESFLEFSSKPDSIAECLPENCVMIRSMTKFYALPGLRLGYAVAHPRFATAIKQQLTPWGVNCFAQAAGIASLKNRVYQEKSRSMINDLRFEFTTSLSQFNFLQVYPSDANFLLIKVADTMNASALKEEFLKKGIAIRECTNFLGLNNNFIRIAIRTREENQYFTSVLRNIQNEKL